MNDEAIREITRRHGSDVLPRVRIEQGGYVLDGQWWPLGVRAGIIRLPPPQTRYPAPEKPDR